MGLIGRLPIQARMRPLEVVPGQVLAHLGACLSHAGVHVLVDMLVLQHANGTFTRWLDALKNTDVLLLDDWGMAAMDSQTRADLLEIIDDRASHRATVITSQLPVEHWHEWIGDQTKADAMLDRLMQNHHRFTLTGESLRKKTTPLKAKADDKPSDV